MKLRFIKESIQLNAFSLAETLIAIGIIGVVSALTIPNLVAKYQKEQTVTKLKETYSILQQAFRLSQEDNGDVDSWDTNLSGKEFFDTYLKNYVKYTDIYTSDELKQKVIWKRLNNTIDISRTKNDERSTHFSLINGALVSIGGFSYGGKVVIIDTNGLNLPNIIGKDNFWFFLDSVEGFVPYGYAGAPEEFYGKNNYDREMVMQKSCNKNKGGTWCAGVIINDGWKISKDYPW